MTWTTSVCRSALHKWISFRSFATLWRAVVVADRLTELAYPSGSEKSL